MGKLGTIKNAVFLQARVGSTRLPRKALLPLGNSTVTRQAMRALKVFPADLYVLLTDSESYELLVPQAAAEGFEIFCGDSTDVLKRYADAAVYYQPERIIRATGDNPLVAGDMIAPLLESHKSADADYSGFDDLPCGAGVEIVQTKALLEAHFRAADPYEREHVNPFLYRRPEEFNILRLRAPEKACFKDGRITIDFPDDYRYVKALFDQLYMGKPLLIEEVISYLKENSREDFQ